ncbi:hypothetical protein [Actinoplanes couchii]|uniref:Secreted protein n=1 Tax=Actinoplanes couchii TaxID=403638 RepID=A0ABQ3XHZ7_9ACTN|nr:hypothetical protein [Actinoplanes couchii]MDR6324580.1 hypothetical protein [Actinoplanes couchii]GID58132.1 hypothetical protein Aco03nite_065360 [Actinoplanes couchii]
MDWPIWRVGAMLTAAMLLTAGCDAGTESASGSEPAVQPTTVVDVRTLTLPLDPYRPDRKQERQLEYGRMLLALKCLRQYGFDVSAPPIAKPFALAVNERRYGVTSEAEVAVYGYRPPFEDGERPEEPEMSKAALSVLTGKDVQIADVPEGGCRGQANRELSDGLDPDAVDWDLAQMLSAKSLKQSEADSRVQAVFGKWSECMKRSGYSYKNPDAVDDDPVMNSGSLTEQEIKTAVADVKCKKEVDLIDTWVAVDVAYQNQFLEKNEEGLAALKAQLDTRLRVAAAVVSGK